MLRTSRSSSRRLEVFLLIATVLVGCRRHRVRAHRVARTQPSQSASVVASASVAPDPPRARSFMLSLPTGNTNPYGKPNVWAHVPSTYRADEPLRVVFVFHGFSNCLESFVGSEPASCRPNDPARTAYDLPAQIERSGTRALTIVPQLAYDEKSGDPGVLSSAAALERLTADVLEKTVGRKTEDIDRVAMIALSAGYQAMYATFGAFGDRARDVYFLDAYYAENGPVDRWLFDNLKDFRRDAGRPRHLGVVYTTIEGTQKASRSLATRVLAAGVDAKSFLHNGEPHDVTVEELRTPIAFVFSTREHDDVPKTDLAKAIAASGI